MNQEKKVVLPGEKRRSDIYKGIVLVVGVIALFLVLRYFPSVSATALSKMSYSASSTPPTAALSDTNAVPVENMQFEVVDTEAKRELGLGNRASVPDNYGMLFVFPTDYRVGFWMKDMQVPLDIIWLSDTGTVVGFDASLATSTYPDVFYAPQPVKYVLETKAGFMAEHGITVGMPFPDLPDPMPTTKQ